MPSPLTLTLCRDQAIAELHKLGFIESSDAPLVGAGYVFSQLVFCFRDRGVDGDGVMWIEDRLIPASELHTFCNKLEDVDRPEPEFDLAQMALSSPEHYRKLQKLKTDDPDEYYRLTHPGEE